MSSESGSTGLVSRSLDAVMAHSRRWRARNISPLRPGCQAPLPASGKPATDGDSR